MEIGGGGYWFLTSSAWEKWLKRFGDGHRIHHFHMARIKGIIHTNLVIFVIIATWKWRIVWPSPNLISHFSHAELVKSVMNIKHVELYNYNHDKFLGKLSAGGAQSIQGQIQRSMEGSMASIECCDILWLIMEERHSLCNLYWSIVYILIASQGNPSLIMWTLTSSLQMGF